MGRWVMTQNLVSNWRGVGTWRVRKADRKEVFLAYSPSLLKALKSPEIEVAGEAVEGAVSPAGLMTTCVLGKLKIG
jgi:hypothetical protein